MKIVTLMTRNAFRFVVRVGRLQLLNW